MNMMKTFVLLAALTLLFMGVGGLLGGRQGMTMAFVLACVMNFASYWLSDKIVLAMYRARPANETEAPELYAIVRELAQKAGIPVPRIYIIPNEAPNAFATGRNPRNAVVAVTQGIMQILDRNELAGVLAHELAHVKHRDILISTVAATLAGAIAMLADMARWAFMFGGSRNREDRGTHPLALIVAMVLMPLAAALIQLAVSRAREFAADEAGAGIEGDPLHLARALEKLESSKQYVRMQAHPSTAHLFIVNPLRADFFAKLFSTHPSTQERIGRLRKMAGYAAE